MKFSNWYAQSKKADLAEQHATMAIRQARQARASVGGQVSHVLGSNKARFWSFAAGMLVGLSARIHGKHPAFSKLIKSTIGLGGLAKIAGGKSRRVETHDQI